MRGKRFRTRREWNNTRLWSMASGFILLIGGLLSLSSGSRVLFLLLLLACLTGAVIAWYRDRGRDAVYSFDGDHITLRTSKHERQFQLSEVSDVSLIDRTAARDYIKQRTRDADGNDLGEADDKEKEFMRFCTVDIGLTTWTFGIGRRMVDRLPDSKKDLVLMRLRNGEALLLSPLYNHDLVESLGRLLQQRVHV